MQKFRVKIRDPIFDSIHVDQDFLDNPPNYVWRSVSGKLMIDETEVELDDWLIFVEDETGKFVPEVICDNNFHRYYEVIDEI